MKARVKATGEIVRIFDKGNGLFEATNGETYFSQSLHFIEDEPDYWEKLKHQAAIAAMQGMLSNSAYMENFVKYAVEGESLVSVTTQNAFDYATALIEKLKNEK